jgi:hypothetical protein
LPGPGKAAVKFIVRITLLETIPTVGAVCTKEGGRNGVGHARGGRGGPRLPGRAGGVTGRTARAFDQSLRRRDPCHDRNLRLKASD